MDAAARKTLLLLTAGVLAAHLLLLQHAARGGRASITPSNRPFATRLLAPVPAGTGRTPAAVAGASPAPAPTAMGAPARLAPRPATRRLLPRASATVPPTPMVAAEPTAPPPAPAVTADGPETTASAASAPAAPPVQTAASSPAEPVAAASAPPQATASTPVAAASASVTPASAATAEQQQQRLLATRYTAPAPVRIGYDISAEIKGVPTSARGELLWQHDGSNYSARLQINLFLVTWRTQTSTGRITEHALAPVRFSDKLRSEVAAHFNEAQGKVTFSANSPDVALQPMAQDRLSIFMQLAGMLAAEPGKYSPGSSIALQTVGPRNAETWVFAVEEEDPQRLGGQLTPARRLVHYPALDFDQKVELWLAPSLGYLPARMRITQVNGDFLDLQWRSDEKP
jgi:hypothetical protein